MKLESEHPTIYSLWLTGKSDHEMQQACDKRLARLIFFIQFTTAYRHVVMWETLQHKSNWVYFRMLFLQTAWKTQHLHPVECCFSEAARLFPKKLELPEADRCFTQEDWSSNCLIRRLSIIWSNSCAHFVGLGNWCVRASSTTRVVAQHQTPKRQNLSQEANGEDTAALPMRQLSGVMPDFQ